MSPTILLGIALLAFSGVLVWIHLRSWRAAAEGDLSKRDRQFAWRQFRRRTQSSAMIGIAAVAILLAPYITSPLLSLFYLIGLFLLVLWIVLLAIVDAIATRRHYVTLQHGELNRMASDNAEARRRQEASDDDAPA